MISRMKQLLVCTFVLLLLFNHSFISCQKACSCSSCTKQFKSTVNDSYQLVNSFTCPEDQSAGYENVRLVSFSTTKTFEYHVVDEENYNLAMQGQPFTDLDGSTNRYACIGNYVDVRATKSQIYMIVKADNETNIWYAPTGKCFVSPANSIKVSFEQESAKTKKVYTDFNTTITFEFLNQLSQIDTFASGYFISGYYPDLVFVNDGKAYLKLTYEHPEKKVLPFEYRPRRGPNNNPNNLTDINLDLNIVRMASKLTFGSASSSSIKPFQTFNIPFKLFDSDGELSPLVFYKYFQIDVEKDGSDFDYLDCKFPNFDDQQGVGEGSLSCASQTFGKFTINISYYRLFSNTKEHLASYDVEIINPNEKVPQTITPIEIASIAISGVSLLIAAISIITIAYLLFKLRQSKSGYSPMN